MHDSVNIKLNLPDSILEKLTIEADERLMTFDELIEVIIVDYTEDK